MKTVPLALPDLDNDDIQAVVRVLRTPHLSLGPLLPEFEQAVARFAGTRRAVAVSSGTAGLHLLVRGLGLGPGDEVVTSPFSFIASANAILFEGANPVFADIDPVTWDLDPAAAEAAVTPQTRALLPVHVFGRPAPMPRYLEIARRAGIAVIEDSCEAIGSTLDGRMAGSFGNGGVFAFYPNKQITTGEGGIIVTDDDRLANDCAAMRNQGRGGGGDWLDHDRLGFNYRLSDFQCALGLSQLRKLERFVTQRERVAGLYGERLAAIPQVIPPPTAAPGQRISWFVYVVALREDFDREDRDRILAGLEARGIGCRNYFAPIHLQPFYRERLGLEPGSFPVAESVSARTIALPFWNRMTEETVDRVVAALRQSLDDLPHR
jgi:perosamine synthetase